MSQPQLDYALPVRRRSRFMRAALLFVRIHAALAPLAGVPFRFEEGGTQLIYLRR